MKLVINGVPLGEIKEAFEPQTPTCDRYDLEAGFSVIVKRMDRKTADLISGDVLYISLKKEGE